MAAEGSSKLKLRSQSSFNTASWHEYGLCGRLAQDSALRRLICRVLAGLLSSWVIIAADAAGICVPADSEAARAPSPLFPEVANPVVPDATLTRYHGEIVAPDEFTHIGVDLAAGCGAKIFSFASGRVERIIKGPSNSLDMQPTYDDSGYDWYNAAGYAVMIRHETGQKNDPYFTTYLHMQSAPTLGESRTELSPGMKISKGQRIGSVGNSPPNAKYNCHTHFEIKDNPNWGGLWDNPDGQPPQKWNIYALTDVTGGHSHFHSAWTDPLDAFCQYPEGTEEGSDLTVGCPDLQVPTRQLTVSADRATFGEDIEVQFVVRNSGSAVAHPSVARIRMAPRVATRATSKDPLLGAVVVPSLAPSGSVICHQPIKLPTELSVGRYKIWTVLDVSRTAGQHPNSETNDHASGTIVIEHRSPDLYYQSFRVQMARPAEGRKAQVSMRVRNGGNAQSHQSRMRIRVTLSPSSVTTGDQLLATVDVPPIAPGGYEDLSVGVQFPDELASGNHYVWGILDVDSNAGQIAVDEENDKEKKRINIH